MNIGTLLVLIGLILAVVAIFVGRVERVGGYVGTIVAVSVAFVALGVLLGAEAFVKT